MPAAPLLLTTRWYAACIFSRLRILSISRCVSGQDGSLVAVPLVTPQAYSGDFRSLPFAMAPDLSIRSSATPVVIETSAPVQRFVFSPSLKVVGPATMASADFCRLIKTSLDVSSTGQTDRSPRVMRVTFLPYTRHIYSPTLPDDYWALKIFAFSPGYDCLVCDFCSSGRDFACGFLQIPPRDGHPCRPASGSRHQGPQRTFTSKSPFGHHNQMDGACAPRALPGAQRKGLIIKITRPFKQ